MTHFSLFLLPVSSKQFWALISLILILFGCFSDSACHSASASLWPSFSFLFLAFSALSPVASLSSQLQPQSSPIPVLSVHLVLQCQSMHTVLLFNAGFLLRLVVFRGSGKTSNWLRTSGDFDRQVGAELDVLISDVLQFPHAEDNSA